MALGKPSAKPTEPADEELSDGEPTAPSPKVKGRRSFAKMRRELTDDELASPGVQKLMMDELDRLEDEKLELTGIRDKYQEASVRCAVLTEKLKPRIASDIFFGGFMTIGAAMLGLAAAVWSNILAGVCMIVFGCILIIAGIASKAVLK